VAYWKREDSGEIYTYQIQKGTWYYQIGTYYQMRKLRAGKAGRTVDAW
jgi:hypothetical protein